MNNRIKEFMQQAGTDISGKWMSVDHAEKFAELIVQECANIANTAEPYQANDLMLKHFGIKQ
jgi:hypothetical protein